MYTKRLFFYPLHSKILLQVRWYLVPYLRLVVGRVFLAEGRGRFADSEFSILCLHASRWSPQFNPEHLEMASSMFLVKYKTCCHDQPRYGCSVAGWILHRRQRPQRLPNSSSPSRSAFLSAAADPSPYRNCHEVTIDFPLVEFIDDPQGHALFYILPSLLCCCCLGVTPIIASFCNFPVCLSRLKKVQYQKLVQRVAFRLAF